MSRACINDCIVRSRDTSIIEPPLLVGNIYLVQIGDITAHLGWVCEPHIQFCHEIVLITEGAAIMTFNSQHFNLSAGQMVIIPASVVHDVRYVSPESTRMLLVGIHFAPSADPVLVEHFTSLPLQLIDSPPILVSLFEALIDEFFSQENYRMRMLQSLVYAVLLKSYRLSLRNDDDTDAPPSWQKELPADPLMRQLCQYIRRHAADMTTLEEVSQKFSYSYSYLSHHFKNVVGYSMKDYWDYYRFQYVFKLMRETDMSLTQIAERLHFQSIHTFSRSFRNKFGVAPSEYRRALTMDVHNIRKTAT